ncbi:dihydrofolate reductase [Opitutus sp. ER46]|uniref:dipeptidyl-peptidase 3 family protein n=1 Tax=Opitutus sp. ER46 TaxID=2161864 RepID=UPI000D309ACA|nr:dihydrofolate reductase [Opitutus sp. ER46]PTX91064.1 dihydrofolate reductase [Opitutus sp. ER46]
MRIAPALGAMLAGIAFSSAVSAAAPSADPAVAPFEFKADRFADIQVLRYQVPGFEQLSLRQKRLAYYLTQAGLAGRDIFWDQKYRHNLLVRKTLEGILTSYSGPRSGPEWEAFTTYAKRVFFASGIHHHYGNAKMLPEFSPAYLASLIAKSDAAQLPLAGKSVTAFAEDLTPILFDPKTDAKSTNLDAGIDNVLGSANNFYRGVTAAEVEAYYAEKTRTGNPRLSYGLNSQLAKIDGQLVERTWKVGGMYGPAIEQIVGWLQKAATVAENDLQKQTIEHLIRFYQTGDINDFDQSCIAWVKDTQSRVDFVNGFIEVYVDSLQKRGSYESVVSMRDEVATKRIAAISDQAQWFEDHAPIMKAHKKASVKGISAKVITVIGETGDAAPSTPIGINLPNAEWIREQHGSKSVSLSNITASYNDVQSKSPVTAEFGSSPEVITRLKQWSALASDLHTDMHEVIGHASGQINPGVGTTDQTLKNYAGTLEEARADLVALYYIMDPKLVEIGVMPSLAVGQAGYDKYVMNALITQLYRIQPGHNLEEAHMRNRQLVAAWAYEKGRAENVIERFSRDGKTFVRINDYARLRALFGDLLREIQRIKSEGDFEAGKALVENYGVKVDQALLTEVHHRYAPLNIAPYMGFIQPKLLPVQKGDEIVDVRVEYPTDFLSQMLEYGREHAFLPVEN